MKRVRLAATAMVLVAAACGGGDDTADVGSTSVATTEPASTEPPVATEPPATTAPTTTEPAAPATTEASATDTAGEGDPTTTTTPPTTTEPAPAEDAERTDLLTFARGAVFVSQTGLAGGSAGSALLSIDGDPYRLGLTTDAAGPVEFVYKMPAATTFDRFAIPDVLEWPGNVTFIKNVVVSGSPDGPDSGYQVLASFELESHEESGQVTDVVPDVMTPVRWVKVMFEGGILIEEGDEGKTALRFSELIGNGVQETQPPSTAFDGVWDFRLTERLDSSAGEPLELRQDGATISGCVGRIDLTGTVNGAIARANGIDTLDGRPSSFIFVADDDGSIQAVWSENKGLFKPWTAVADPEVTSSPCSETPPPETFPCGAIAYVNFDKDSAVLRPEAGPVLSDMYDGLVGQGVASVSIEGHTSTEGTDEYNQGLSERRAQAVVDDLVARGYDPAAISATGFGETMPLISPDDDETSRELNRRVEISCT
jgi:outer membrane protein OmpA-like peptidoglycan-associated protein